MRKLCFSCVIAVFLIFILGQAGYADVMFVKLATTLSPEHPTFQALLQVQRGMEDAFPGEINIQVFPEAQLGNTREILKGLQFGNIEMGVVPSDLLASVSPMFEAISLPYIFRNDAHRFRVLDGPLGGRFLNILKGDNLIGLGFFDTGMRNMLTRQGHFETPEAFHGKRIGVMRRDTSPKDVSDQISERVKANLIQLNALPEILEQGDVFRELQTEQIMGVECSLTEVLSLQLADIDTIYWTSAMLSAVPDVFVVSRQWFVTLSSQQQQMLRNVARIAVMQQRKGWQDYIQQLRSTLEKQGVQMKDIERTAFYEAVQPLYQNLSKQFGADFTAIIEAMTAVK